MGIHISLKFKDLRFRLQPYFTSRGINDVRAKKPRSTTRMASNNHLRIDLAHMDDSAKSTVHELIFQDINSYTRVTEVLYPFSGLANLNPETVANAARRGTKVHEICESIIQNNPLQVDEETTPYIESFNQWWSLGHKVVSLEQRFFDNDLKITGQVDIITQEPDGTHSIVDIKTSYRPSKTWPLQGSAYAYLANNAGYNIQAIKFLHLNRLGGFPKVYVYEYQWDMYKKCLDVYNYFFKKKV